MQYEQIKNLPEALDPSITIETGDLIAKVIDNTGLLLQPDTSSTSWITSYGLHKPLPFSRPLGGHGIRTLYQRQERRNIVAPFASWLSLQHLSFDGINNDPVDERAWAGVMRGWPLRLEQRDGGARLRLEPLPETQFSYALDIRPAGADCLDFSVRFVFHRKPAEGRSRFRASWANYMNSYEKVGLFYPQGSETDWHWALLGETPEFIPGETVGYEHRQSSYWAEGQAFPLAYGHLGPYAAVFMFDDPRLRLFLVNAGGHLFFNTVHNPAWDFEWVIEDYPLDQPVGFKGRIIYNRFESAAQVWDRYRLWKAEQEPVLQPSQLSRRLA